VKGRPLDAVTFDFWNTLAHEERGHLRGRRLEAWAGLLEDAGFAVSRERLDAVLDESWQRYVEHWKANRQFQFAEAAEHCLEALGYDVPPDVRDKLVDAFGRVGEHAELHLTEGIGDCLAALAGRGVRLGIVCDVGMTPSPILRDFLDRAGLLKFFGAWAFSDEVGHYKPSPVIFEHVLAGLGGVAPARAAHVGDLRRTDVAGARAMGMVAVRYTGVYDDDADAEGQPEADVVVASHAELPAALGLA
jgi:putative hydrolase of the HAD superfamily